MPITVYTLIHIVGILLLVQSVTAAVYHSWRLPGEPNPHRKLLTITHGIAMLLMLVSGFGMLARLGLTDGLPLWIYAKLLIWLVFGASIALVNRGKGTPMTWWILIIVLGGAAGWLGIFKPF